MFVAGGEKGGSKEHGASLGTELWMSWVPDEGGGKEGWYVLGGL